MQILFIYLPILAGVWLICLYQKDKWLKNQFLFKLEQTNELYNVKMSQLGTKELLAQRQQILTQLNYNEINYRRIVDMRQQNAASQNDLDAAQRDLNISKQQLNDINTKIKSNQVDVADKNG